MAIKFLNNSNVEGSVTVSKKLLLESADYDDHLSIRRGVYGYDTIVTGTRIDYSPTSSTDTFKFLAKVHTTGQLIVNNGIEMTSGNFNAGDNERIRLGNSADLQIYHDGSNSFIQDAGTGSLKTVTSGFQLLNSTQTQFMMLADGGATSWIKLYYSGSERLATTSTGVDVTGTARMDTGITEGIHYVGTAVEHWGDGGTGMSFPANDTLSLRTASSDRLYITSAGNVGIGTTAPLKKLSVNGGDIAVNNGNGFIVGAAITGNTEIGRLSASSGQLELITESTRDIKFASTAHGNIMFLEGTNGNVGIGTTSPIKRLDLRTSGTGDGITLATSTPKTFAQIINGNSEAFPYGKFTMNYGDTTPVQIVALSNELQLSGGYTTGGKISFRTATSEQMRLTETGLGIGTTTPDFKLDVDGTFGVSDLPFNTDSVSVLVADETIGAELTTNGDFAIDADWAKGSGVTIASGVGTWTNTVNNVGLSQSITFTANAYYKCNVTVSNYSSGSFRFRYPGISSPRITANGTYSLIIKADQSTNNTLYLQGETNGDANVNFSIDNVSVKQITSASNQIQKRELGTGAFGPTPVGAYLPLAGGTMTGNTDHNDNVFSKYGTADQLRIWNNGSNSYIFNYTSGNINIGNDAVDKDVIFYADRGDGLEDVFFRLDGSETNGTTVLGVTLFPDKSQARFGNQGDLRIYHDGSNSYIQDTGTGTLNLQGSTQVLIGGTNGEVGVQYVENAGVGLRHNNVTKLSTESTGINVVGGIKIDSALLSNQENTDVDTGTETVASVAIATYTAAFFDFVIKKTTNVRSGTVYACHDGTNVEFTETSTNDLGDTSDVTLSVDISGANMRLLATVTSDDWSVKSLIRAI
jgi:hypothetical protein